MLCLLWPNENFTSQVLRFYWLLPNCWMRLGALPLPLSSVTGWCWVGGWYQPETGSCHLVFKRRVIYHCLVGVVAHKCWQCAGELLAHTSTQCNWSDRLMAQPPSPSHKHSVSAAMWLLRLRSVIVVYCLQKIRAKSSRVSVSVTTQVSNKTKNCHKTQLYDLLHVEYA